MEDLAALKAALHVSIFLLGILLVFCCLEKFFKDADIYTYRNYEPASCSLLECFTGYSGGLISVRSYDVIMQTLDGELHTFTDRESYLYVQHYLGQLYYDAYYADRFLFGIPCGRVLILGPMPDEGGE